MVFRCRGFRCCKTSGYTFTNHISSVKIEKVELAFKAESTNQVPVFFVFNLNTNDGFIIISAEDASTPVIGYSLNGRFSNIDL
ncbi:MAG: Spi family protease inhibitor, partial [Saprospiraceae bacterium]|nr:Spi family protease inhibitor [Candidatus Vicinibacter affinis]